MSSLTLPQNVPRLLKRNWARHLLAENIIRKILNYYWYAKCSFALLLRVCLCRGVRSNVSNMRLTVQYDYRFIMITCKRGTVVVKGRTGVRNVKIIRRQWPQWRV